MNGVVLTEGTTAGLDTIIDAVGKVITLAGTCLNAIVQQPILVFFLAVGFVGIGLGVFRKMKRTAQG